MIRYRSTGLMVWAILLLAMATFFDLSDQFKLIVAFLLTVGCGIATTVDHRRTANSAVPISVIIWAFSLGIFYLTFGLENIFQFILTMIVPTGWANVFYQIAAWLSTEIKKMEKEVMIPHG